MGQFLACLILTGLAYPITSAITGAIYLIGRVVYFMVRPLSTSNTMSRDEICCFCRCFGKLAWCLRWDLIQCFHMHALGIALSTFRRKHTIHKNNKMHFVGRRRNLRQIATYGCRVMRLEIPTSGCAVPFSTLPCKPLSQCFLWVNFTGTQGPLYSQSLV